MLFTDFWGDPDDDGSIQSCCIGDQLAEMPVISLGQLIFDNNATTAASFARLNVACEGPNRCLGLYEFKVEAHRLSKQRQVLREPRSEICGFHCPD
jgi:hypothetical protein